MKLMCSDKIVAYSTTIDGQPVMVRVKGTTADEIPFGLFTKSDYMSSFDFTKWACQRCFPEERVDAAEVLDRLGLDRYDRWEIVKITGARLTGSDDFWVDFYH